MPRLIDHDERNRVITDAAMRVLERDGLGSMSVRAVADEAGLATASLRRAFPTQNALREHCLTEIQDRVTRRLLALSGSGEALVDALLAELLPLDHDRRLELVAQLQLGVLAMTDEQLRPSSAALTTGVRRVCEVAVAELERCGLLPEDADVEREADALHAVLDGVAFQSLLDPEMYPPAGARRRIQTYVSRLVSRAATHRGTFGPHAPGSAP